MGKINTRLGFIMDSPYIYTKDEIAKMPNHVKHKFLKALVYDFMKKNRLMGIYFDNYIAYHSADTRRGFGGKTLFDVCLNEGMSKIIAGNTTIGDFFFSHRVSFPWNDDIKDFMRIVDNKWLHFWGLVGC